VLITKNLLKSHETLVLRLNILIFVKFGFESAYTASSRTYFPSRMIHIHILINLT
jgi:hypothetical protein